MICKKKPYTSNLTPILFRGISVCAILMLVICNTNTASANILEDISMGQSHSLSNVKKAYTDGPFGQIHYRYAGAKGIAGIPLICLHPSPLSGIVYENWLAEMGTDRYTLAPDTPGYGGSDTPKKPQQIDSLADAIIQFMNNLGIQEADVMGYHTGSFTAAHLAMRYPHRIKKVVMISAPIFDDKIIEEYSARIYGPPPKFVNVLQQLSENIIKNGKGMFRDIPTDERYADIQIEMLRNYRTSNWGFRAAFAYNLTDTLPKVDQQILVLNPEDDLWEHTPKAQEFLKNGTIHNLPGWTHGHLDAHTKEMATIVRKFLD